MVLPLEYPEIDPRNEADLVEQSIAAVFGYSGGLLNDFSSSGPLRVLLEGLCFASAELLYYANKLPKALLVAYLSNYGITRNEGTFATVQLQITLTASFTSAITIPAGYIVRSTSGNVSFATTQALIFPAGISSGVVPAAAQQLGTVGNVAANQITQPLQPLSFVSGVTNPEAATGGSDQETEQEAIDRGIAEVRRRNLVSADDYEAEARDYFGVGSVAKAIGNLSGDKTTQQLGSVHVFVLDAQGSTPNQAALNELQGVMQPRVMIGTTVWVSPIELVDVDAKLVARLVEGEDPAEVSAALWAAMQAYLAPTAYPVGQDLILKELEYALRQTGRIAYVESLILNGEGANLAMPEQYAMPSAFRLETELVDAAGNIFRAVNGPQVLVPT